MQLSVRAARALLSRLRPTSPRKVRSKARARLVPQLIAGVGRQETLMRLAAVILVFTALAAHASEAPPGMRAFNVRCPAPRLLPQLDAAYHECNNYYQN